MLWTVITPVRDVIWAKMNGKHVSSSQLRSAITVCLLSFPAVFLAPTLCCYDLVVHLGRTDTDGGRIIFAFGILFLFMWFYGFVYACVRLCLKKLRSRLARKKTQFMVKKYES